MKKSLKKKRRSETKKKNLHALIENSKLDNSKLNNSKLDNSKLEEGLNFSVLVMSFAASALQAMGQDLQSQNSELTGPSQPHLARLNIDLLLLLKEKTAGNLSKEETQFLNSVIYDLQQRYLRLA